MTDETKPDQIEFDGRTFVAAVGRTAFGRSSYEGNGAMASVSSSDGTYFRHETEPNVSITWAHSEHDEPGWFSVAKGDTISVLLKHEEEARQTEVLGVYYNRDPKAKKTESSSTPCGSRSYVETDSCTHLVVVVKTELGLLLGTDWRTTTRQGQRLYVRRGW